MNIILGDAFQKDAGTTGTIDYEIRILLDNIDYTEDVVQEKYKRHADKVFSDGLFRFECSEKSGEKVENPWDEMEDTKSAPFIVLSPEDAPMDEKVLPVTESFKTVFQRFL